ncbi:hypothetical protein SAMN05720468_103110 [Fibrobacter sp. UWEL]|nr:hypothetical protein SAMN05720468_103110 [Fibrobacter sp. UWEL]
MKKSILAFSAISFVTLGLVACGDSDSSPSSPTGTPVETPVSSSSVVPAAISSSSTLPVAVSSSSVAADTIVWEYATDCYEGGANITISNIENLNMQCGGSTEGWKIYDKDHWLLYTCKNGQWLEEEAIPCVLE